MSTRPLGPPTVLTDDPGPWSVVSSVFANVGRPGRRRPQPPMGLMLSPAPETALQRAGLDAASPIAGAAPIRIVAAAREAAFALVFDEGDALLRAVSPFVRRAWSVPEMAQRVEERPGEDPAAGLPDPVASREVTADGAAAIATAPGGGIVAVHAREGRSDVVAVVRLSDGTLLRWVRGARAAAWSSDGRLFAVGGPWGVLLAERIPEPAEG